MPYNPLNPFESYTHVYSPAPNLPAVSTKPTPHLPSDPFEAADPKQIAAQDLLYTQQQPLIEATYEARGQAALALKVRAAQRKKHWQTQAAKRKQERADKRYGSREQAALALVKRDAKRLGDSYYRVLILDRKIDNKYHARLISKKKVAHSPDEVSKIHAEIKALLVKIRETKVKISEYKAANKKVMDKANLNAALLPTAPVVEVVVPNPRFDAVVQHMQLHPEHLEDDAAYNAMHRIAQICLSLAGKPPATNIDYLRQTAVGWLRIPLWQSYYLFAPERTTQDFIDWQLMTSSQRRLCIVSQDGNALAYIHDEHRTNELCIAAMNNTPEAFQFLTKKQRTKEVCEAAGMPYLLYIDPKKIKSYRVDTKMDAATKAAFQSS